MSFKLRYLPESLASLWGEDGRPTALSDSLADESAP